jgi:hypothetical protein
VYAPVLIDTEGEVRFVGAPETRRAIANAPDSDWLNCAVRELGFVLVRERPTSVQIWLRPSLVTEAALIALFYHVAEAAPERVLLSYLIDEWHHEVVRTAREAMLRVEDLVLTARASRPPMRYQAQSHPSQLLRHEKYRHWAPLLAVWELTGGCSPGRLIDMLRSWSLLDRATVLRNPLHSERLLFEHHGGAYSFYAPYRNMPAIGRDFEDQPDRHFAASVANAYRSALGSREPRFEAVDAVARTPGRLVRRSRYDRLILPWQSATGERFVTSLWNLRTSYAFESA